MTGGQFMLMVMGVLAVGHSLYFLIFCKNRKTIGAAALAGFFGVATLQGVLDSVREDAKEQAKAQYRMEVKTEYKQTGELKDEK